MLTKRYHSPDKKSIYAWALYDWANSAFATTVMAGFFPIFFKQYWSFGNDVTTSTAQLATSNSIAGLIVAICAPVLGSIADNSRSKKSFLLFFVLLGIIASASLSLVDQGDWLSAAMLYALGLIGYIGGNIFYDALIVNVSTSTTINRVSALGFALGYVGGGLLFAMNVIMYQYPSLFGISSGVMGIKASFLTVACWWALFTLPLLRWVNDRNPEATTIRQSITKGLRQFWQTVIEIRKYRNVVLFLISYWVYIDGVHTVIVMAIDYGMSIGLSAKNLIPALLITQAIGFPATLFFGRLATRYGAKTGIFIALTGYTAIAVYSYFMTTVVEFYLLASAVGLVQGGVQCLSRSLFGRIIPQDKSGEFFGFYNMMGKFATIVGPALMAAVVYFTKNPRLSITIISALFIIGGAILVLVKDQKPATE